MAEFGMVADHFEGVGAKYLTPVEIDIARSNQHEFQGVGVFRRFLGEPAEKVRFPSTFFWFDDDWEEQQVECIEAFCTWSDVRRANPNRTAEYHLYYAAEAEPVVHRASEGDLLIIAKTKTQELLVIICPAGTTISQQLLWLFGLDLASHDPGLRNFGTGDGREIGISALAVLEKLGIEIKAREDDALDRLIDTFGLRFPPTAEFSEFARNTAGDVDPLTSPDHALVKWMEHEEALFRHLERRIVADRLENGFMTKDGADVDGFISFSLSVQNRRKSRAGWAFGHHVDAILRAHGLQYKREARTEKPNGPDFLFPGEEAYHSDKFDPGLLTMLAAKTSCKDRWRQVLAEANKIETKHLVTLQPGISKSQTTEMEAANLQLVVPSVIFDSYIEEQQSRLLTLQDFLELVDARQQAAHSLSS